ncbi:hypothetical protein [Henriciella aquimarina]|uniref:hypothetical protein n=1 Tax=Henriciella aquimarina TaxID=545261 RepID=UPI000A01EFA7|nr:hypothetical protein [Henriciella aquimarina]
MTSLVPWLTRTPVIIASGLAMVIVGISFSPVQKLIDGPLLDMIWSGPAAEARLAEMTAVQRTAHFWGTVLNDTAYPIFYGAFLAGLSGRFAPQRWKGWVMLPALLTVVADLAENTVQALALSGTADLLGLKSLLTPVKFGLFTVAGLLAFGLVLFALARWGIRRGRGS